MYEIRSRRSLRYGALLLVSLAVVGCAEKGDAQPEPTANSSSADRNNSETTAGADASTSAVDPRTCLHGAWLADNEHFLESMREFGDEITGVSGEVTLTFTDDGAITTEYRGWRITAVAEGMESVITREGVDRGSFTSDEHRVNIHETDMNSILTVSIGGADMVVSPEPVDYSQAEYTCGESDAAISTPDGNVILSRLRG